jgi:hypothetical protein
MHFYLTPGYPQCDDLPSRDHHNISTPDVCLLFFVLFLISCVDSHKESAQGRSYQWANTRGVIATMKYHDTLMIVHHCYEIHIFEFYIWSFLLCDDSFTRSGTTLPIASNILVFRSKTPRCWMTIHHINMNICYILIFTFTFVINNTTWWNTMAYPAIYLHKPSLERTLLVRPSDDIWWWYHHYNDIYAMIMCANPAQEVNTLDPHIITYTPLYPINRINSLSLSDWWDIITHLSTYDNVLHVMGAHLAREVNTLDLTITLYTHPYLATCTNPPSSSKWHDIITYIPINILYMPISCAYPAPMRQYPWICHIYLYTPTPYHSNEPTLFVGMMKYSLVIPSYSSCFEDIVCPPCTESISSRSALPSRIPHHSTKLN